MKENLKRTIMGSIVLFCLFLIYYIHIRLKIDIVFTHLFYIAIILSAIWWGRISLLIALLLGMALIISGLFSDKDFIVPDVLRALMFLFVAVVTTYYMDKNKKYLSKIAKNEELKETAKMLFMQNEEINLINKKLLFINKAVESASDAIGISDAHGHHFYQNKAFSELFEYSSAEELGANGGILKITRDPLVARERIAKVLNGIPWSGELELITKSGRVFPAFERADAIKDNDGKILGMVCVIIDISERKKLEQIIKKSEIKYKNVADFTFDWEYWVSDEDEFVFISPSCERITGYTVYDFITNRNLVKEIIHEDDLALFKKHEVFVTESKTSDEIDIRITTREGNVRWLNHICHPVYDENGNYLGKRGSNRDITERKKTENQVIELNKKLSESDADKNRFISILGHDLRSPFSSILGLSDLLKENIRKYDIAEIENIVDLINKSVRNTYNLLEDILMWTRTQSGNIPFKPGVLNFRDSCKEVFEIYNPHAKAKNITINYCAPAGITVFADGDLLKTVMRNLLSNAIKFTNNNGVININAEGSNGNITISVSDNGIGIKPADLGKLFDISQFITTKGTAEETGTGLGLLLCKGFVEKHGGKIWVDSEPLKGSNFKFTLPGMVGKTSRSGESQ